jgi:hypothetical protein
MTEERLDELLDWPAEAVLVALEGSASVEWHHDGVFIMTHWLCRPVRGSETAKQQWLSRRICPHRR